MGEVINRRPSHFKMADDLLALVKAQLQMGVSNEKILIDIADQLTDVWRDGKVYGQSKAIEDFTHDLQAVIADYEGYEAD